MTDRSEAQHVAAALVAAVIDEDQEGAEVLLGHSSHQVIAQACTELALWITATLGDGAQEFRHALMAQLSDPRDWPGDPAA